MSNPRAMQDLIDHLCRQSPLTEQQANHVLDEILSYFNETSDAFIVRRHQELQAHGFSNTTIFKTIKTELEQHRFVARSVSERQIRRVIYG